MKIALDEHISPKVIDAISGLLEDARHGEIIVVSAYKYAEPPARSDVPWLRKFALDGGNVVVTADKKMRSRLHERQALLDLEFIAIFTPANFADMKFMEQAAYLLMWWSVIVNIAKSKNKSTCWELPKDLSGNEEKVEDVTGPK